MSSIDLGNAPVGTPPNIDQQAQIRSSIQLGVADNVQFAGITATDNLSASSLVVNDDVNINATTITYGAGAAAAHRTAMGLGTGDDVQFAGITGTTGTFSGAVTVGGNIGIGTTTPTAPLTIRNGVESDIHLRSATLNQGTHKIKFGFVGDNADSYSAAIVGKASGNSGRGHIEFWINNTASDTAQVTSTNKVLEVNTNGIKNFSDVFRIGLATNTIDKVYRFVASDAKAGIWSKPSGSFGGGDIRFTTGNNASSAETSITSASVKIDYGGGMAIGNSYMSSTIADGRLIVSGNVGIGTNTPAVELDVVGDLTASGTVTGKSFIEGVYDAGTPAGAGVTLSLVNGSVQKIALTAATSETVTLPAVVAGATLIVEVLQAAGGTGTVTFQHADASAVIWPGGSDPTMTPTASYVDVFSFVANHAGTKWRGTAAQNFAS